MCCVCMHVVCVCHVCTCMFCGCHVCMHVSGICMHVCGTSACDVCAYVCPPKNSKVPGFLPIFSLLLMEPQIRTHIETKGKGISSIAALRVALSLHPISCKEVPTTCGFKQMLVAIWWSVSLRKMLPPMYLLCLLWYALHKSRLKNEDEHVISLFPGRKPNGRA